ncbi:MAG: hypothetical protein AB7N76_22885 [Planctomycetota bacterium]
MNLKTINHFMMPVGGRKKPRHCERDGCSQATREGKPFCSEHVEELPYVREVQARIDARESEHQEVERRGARAVDPYGPTARDILVTLWINGERSVARLARELNLDFRLVKDYVKSLKRARLIDVTPARRGAGKARLVPALAALEDPTQLGLEPLRPAQPLALDGLSSAEAV